VNNVRRIHVIVGMLLLGVGTALAGERGSALKADDLKAEPYRDAKTVGSLAPGEPVEILKKQAGWFQVKSAKGGGWVRMLSIRRGEARRGDGDGVGLLGLASGRAGTGRVVATTGIRGLSEDALKEAKYSEAEVQRVESYATSRAEAQRFASSGRLVARKMTYLSAPESAQGERP
jgi:hypothetical protein